MIEARIECVCSQIGLPDLDLSLTKGQVVHMDASKARRSKDLQRAWQAKAVTIKYIERFRKRREAPVPRPIHPLVPVSRVAAPAVDQAPAGEHILLVDPGEIAARVVQELGRGPVNEKVRVEVGRQLKALEDRLVARVSAAVLAAIQTMPVQVARPLPGVDRPTRAIVAGIDDDVPVYVPSKIGDNNLKADLDLPSKRAEKGNVSEAAAALRAARKAGKKRRTEKPG